METIIDGMVASPLPALHHPYPAKSLPCNPGLSGMHPSQSRGLCVLAREENIPVSEDEKRLSIPKPCMTILIDSRAGMGRVGMNPDPDYRHVFRLSLGEKGRQHLHRTGTALRERIREYIRMTDEKDIPELSSLQVNLQEILLKLA